MYRPPKVKNADDARALRPSVAAQIEVPTALVPAAVWLAETLQKPTTNPVAKVVKTLLKNRERRG